VAREATSVLPGGRESCVMKHLLLASTKYLDFSDVIDICAKSKAHKAVLSTVDLCFVCLIYIIYLISFSNNLSFS